MTALRGRNSRAAGRRRARRAGLLRRATHLVALVSVLVGSAGPVAGEQGSLQMEQGALPMDQGAPDALVASELAGQGSDPAALADAPSAHLAEPLGPGFPTPTMRADGHRSEIEAAWFSGGNDLGARAYNARNAALRLGAANVESAARALLAAGGTEAQRLTRARLAVEIAPDLPPAHMALARSLLHAGEFTAAVGEAIAGLAAIPRNLEASLWLAGSLLGMFAVVLVAGPMLFISWVGIGVFRHGAHDLGDLISGQMPNFARASLLAAVLLVPVVLGESLMGIVLSFFVLGCTYADARGRRALVLAAALLVLGLYPLARATGIALGALEADPTALAAHAVVRTMASPIDLELLASAEDRDDLAASALALWERRAGNREVAMARYTRLLEEDPTDPVVLSALANMHFELGENERSIELSEQAAGQLRSATILFNLSQVYARSFRMDEFEGAMAQAQGLDAEAIAGLSRTAAPDFVADLPFDTLPVWARLVEQTGDDAFIATTSRVVMPGWLGSSWIATSGSFALAALLALFLGGRWEHSSACRRCGNRICTRCNGTVWNAEICDGCHHLFHRPESTDPKMRLARLSELRERETRIGRLALASSLLLPGVGGLLARRPDLSFLGLFFFAWGVVLFVWRDGIVVDPLAVGAAGPLAFVLGGVVVAMCYAAVVGLGLWIRRSL